MTCVYDERMAMQHRHYRIENDAYNSAQARANTEGVPLSERIRQWLIDYGNEAWIDAENRAAAEGTSIAVLVHGWMEMYAAGKMPAAPLNAKAAKRIRKSIDELEAVLVDSR